MDKNKKEYNYHQAQYRKQVIGVILVCVMLLGGLYLLQRNWRFYDDQLWVAGRQADWVNNELLIGDGGATDVHSSWPFCSPDVFDKKIQGIAIQDCLVLLATVPKKLCPYWPLLGDCYGLFTTSELLSREDIREKIINALQNACTSAPPEYFRTDYYCTDGALSSDIFILSIDRQENTLQLAFVVPKMTRKAALHHYE